MNPPEAEAGATSPETMRDPSLRQLEAFSNGVFAFAITLLALNLVLPRLTGSVGAGRLLHQLGTEWPQFLSYILSFILIGLVQCAGSTPPPPVRIGKCPECPILGEVIPDAREVRNGNASAGSDRLCWPR